MCKENKLITVCDSCFGLNIWNMLLLILIFYYVNDFEYLEFDVIYLNFLLVFYKLSIYRCFVYCWSCNFIVADYITVCGYC